MSTKKWSEFDLAVATDLTSNSRFVAMKAASAGGNVKMTATEFLKGLFTLGSSAGTGISITGSVISLNATTTLVNEGTNLYYTDTRARNAFSAGTGIGLVAGVISLNATTTNVPEGSNLYYSDVRARAAISAGTGISVSSGVISLNATTTNVPEGSNLYYTDARARAAITGGTGITVTTGVVAVNLTAGTGISIAGATISLNTSTTNVSEGSNLYYTDARARASITAGTGITVTSGVVALNATTSNVSEGSNLYYTNARAQAAITAGTGISVTSGVVSLNTSTTNISEGTHLYYTDARAQAAITAGTGITVTTGVVAIATTYQIPTARSISTTSPLSGGGDLSADRTLTIANAAADGTTKGAAAFNSTNFSASSGVVNTIQGIATTATPQWTRLGIGVAADSVNLLTFTQAVASTGSPTVLTLTGGAHTTLSNAETSDCNFNLARTVQFTGSTTLALQRAFRIQAPTYSSDTATKTITDAATLDISGAPVAGTNVTITTKHALRVNAGTPSANGITVIGAASQTGDLIQARDSSGNILFEVGSGGTLYVRNGTATKAQFGTAGNAIVTLSSSILQSWLSMLYGSGIAFAETGNGGPTNVGIVCNNAGNLTLTNGSTGVGKWEFLQLAAGAAAAGKAPLKFTSGTNLTTGEAGAMEYNGTNLFFTRSGTTREGVLTQSAVTTETVISDTTVTVNIGGTTYKLLARA